ELLCECGIKAITEVPISFGCREAGESKLSWRQRVKFVQHLGRLYAFQYPRAAMVLKAVTAAVAGILFAAITNLAYTPLISIWVAVATLYATRPNRPPTKSITRSCEDREIDLHDARLRIEIAA